MLYKNKIMIGDVLPAFAFPRLQAWQATADAVDTHYVLLWMIDDLPDRHEGTITIALSV